MKLTASVDSCIYMQVKPLVLIKALAMLHIAVVQGSRKEGHSIHLTPLCRVSHPVLPYPQCTLLGNHRYFGPSLLDGSAEPSFLGSTRDLSCDARHVEHLPRYKGR